MARKILDITHSASQYDILSQTPKNYDRDNYFLKELQDKVNAEWDYRPNRVDIEYEQHWGEQCWKPIQVVIQSVRSEKGSSISDDCKRIVFKNILEDRFVIGSRFRFSPKFFHADKDIDKNVWLATNTDQVKFTSSMVIERCNGILGSIYVDKQGVSHYHYEPVIQGKDLTSVNLFFNETAVSPQSQLLVIAQYNEYTKRYKVNQRFIVGARYYDEEKKEWVGQVYRVKAINRFYANSTNKPEDVGLIRIYLEVTEAGPYDDWENRIAYEHEPTIHISSEDHRSEYYIKFKTPDFIPTDLTSKELTFTPIIVSDEGVEYPEFSQNIEVSWALENLPEIADPNKFISFTNSTNEDQLMSFTLQRKRLYLNGDLIVTCRISEEYSPTGEELVSTFRMVVRNKEVD